jgi:hypothetical protein
MCVDETKNKQVFIGVCYLNLALITATRNKCKKAVATTPIKLIYLSVFIPVMAVMKTVSAYKKII